MSKFSNQSNRHNLTTFSEYDDKKFSEQDSEDKYFEKEEQDDYEANQYFKNLASGIGYTGEQDY